MSVDNTKVSVYLGFGGTGGKVLREFSKLVAADDGWSEKAASHLYLVLCDTDEDELKDSDRGIRELFPARGHRPMITEVSLADGLGAFGQTVRREWDDAAARGREAVARLEEKWWCDEGDPFTAHRVPYNIDEGAGQCPMVSYFLAWWQGGQIRDKVDALAAEIDARIPHGGDRPPVELTVVNSLAGGTGRGSWTVLTFLIRRALERRGWHPSAIGLFLDQGCFSQVMESRPEQRFKMKVNSLTGLSEVVMWTRIDDEGRKADKPSYHLPDFSSPERAELDLIRDFVPEDLSASPLGYAQFIFAAGRSGGLPGMDDYYGVAASAMYAQLSMPAIKSQQQNAMPRVGGVGSARVAVPFVEIERFVKDYCIHDLLEGANTDDPEDGLDLEGLLGPFDPRLNGEGAETGLVAKLLQRLMEVAAKEKVIEKFKDSIEKDDADNASRMLRAIAAGNRESGRDRLRSIIADAKRGPFADRADQVDLADLSRHLIQGLGDHLEADLGRLGATRGSAARLAKALQGLRQRLEQELRRILGVQHNDEIEQAPDGLALKSLSSDLKKMSAKSIRTAWLKKFDAAERTHLASKVSRVWAEETLVEVLMNDLLPHVRQAEKAVRTFESNLAFIIERGFGGEWQSKRKGSLQKAERDIFISTHRRHGRDRWNLSDGFRESRSSARYGRRKLRPRLDKDLLSEECRKFRIKQTTPRAIECELSGKIFRLAMEGMPDPSRSRTGASNDAFGVPSLAEEHAGPIQRLVRSDVDALVQALDVERWWLREHYAFDKVIEGQLEAWQSEFQRTSGPALSALCRDFEMFYGLPPEDTGAENGGKSEGKPAVPEVWDVLRALVLSTARSCEPLMQVRSGREQERRKGDLAMAALPACFGDKPDSPEIMKLKESHAKAGIASANWVYPSTNPYVLTVYTNQGFALTESGDDDSHFQRVRSLDYWQDADEDNVADWLSKAEDPSGASVFSKEMRNSGLGYPDPTLVRDPAFAGLRWRPWYRHEEAARESQAHRATDAVLYAMYGHVGTRSSDETKELVGELADRFARKELHAWAMPNIRWEGRRMWFQRDAVQVDDRISTANGLLVDGAPTRLTLTKFMAAISATDEPTRRAVDGLMAERTHFHEEMPSRIGISDDHFRALHQGVEDFLVDLEVEVSKRGGGEKDAFVALVAGLLARHRESRP